MKISIVSDNNGRIIQASIGAEIVGGTEVEVSADFELENTDLYRYVDGEIVEK